MIVFKNYFKIVKTFLPTIILYIVIFGVIAVVSTQDETRVTFEQTKPKIYIENNDLDSKLSETFIKFIEKNSEIIELKEDDIKDAIFNRKIDFAINIQKGFGEDFLEGKEPKIDIVKRPDSYDANYGQLLFEKFFNISNVYIRNGLSEEMVYEKILIDLEKETEIVLLEESKNELENLRYFYNFMNYTIFSTVIYITGMLIRTFNIEKIKNRNIISPISYKKINRELFLGNACLTIGIWVLYVIMSIALYNKSVFNINAYLLILNSFIFSIVALSLGFLVGNLVTNKEVQNGIVNVIALGTSFISGAFVPQELLGDKVLEISKIFPSYWYITNNGKITTITNFTNENLNAIIKNMGIMILFGVAYFVITNSITKIKLKKS